MQTKSSLIEFEQAYPGIVKKENADDIIEKLKRRKNLQNSTSQL
ncbi:hypothetical protein BRYFOR_09088 [Marvinbryantia formatexigens DSM 14469]|uniref:Uncharacterized protein n=1 Tax=Marvinbryantia formatexigens DSM 14469 TaxID=478749 RepID=C6LKA1_9FIRM|nr:hypothetical protein [Marvinbryantia formatexigens]EET58982.1 hypothetical protein BRYFOR_09088 [Marvinbryantia formatexigens DSM 14469]UWO23413.1 hypothetical protein NQ534_13240 [Marvinbryantia formatexigens DSM 14469]